MTKPKGETKTIPSPAVQECKDCGCQKVLPDGNCAAIAHPHTMWDSGRRLCAGKWLYIQSKTCWAQTGDPLWEEIVRRQVAAYTVVVAAKKEAGKE